jgi:hypothetical protein
VSTFRRIASFILCLLPTLAFAQRGGNIRPIQNLAESCSDAVEGGACDTPKLWCITASNTALRCAPITRVWEEWGGFGTGFSVASDLIVIGAGSGVTPTASECSASGNQLDCPADATAPGSISLKEPESAGGLYSFQFYVNDLSANVGCGIDANGLIPLSCLATGQTGTTVGSSYAFDWDDGITATCSDLSGSSCEVDVESREAGFLNTGVFTCNGSGPGAAGLSGATAQSLTFCSNEAVPALHSVANKDDPIHAGKMEWDELTEPVDDDVCTSDKAKLWYDDTDNRWEFCDANASAPISLNLTHATDCTGLTASTGQFCTDLDNNAVWVCVPSVAGENCDTAGEWETVGGGGSGDVTDVLGCGGADCTDITSADGVLLDMAAVNLSATTEGIILPQATSVSSATAEGQIGWDTDQNVLYVGNAAAAQPIGQGRWGSFPLIDNRWYGCNLGENLGTSTTDASAGVGTTVDRAYACPIYLERPYNFDSAGFVTAVAGTNLYVAVYAMSATGLPGALEHGVATITTSGVAGSKTAAINWTVQAGWHWLVWKSDNSSMQGNNKWTMSATAYTSSPYGAGSLPVTAESTFYGACAAAPTCSDTLPSNWSETDGNTYVDSDLPQVMLQVNNP